MAASANVLVVFATLKGAKHHPALDPARRLVPCRMPEMCCSRVACTCSKPGSRNKVQHPSTRLPPQIGDRKRAWKYRLARFPPYISNIPGRAKGTTQGPKGSHAPGRYFDDAQVWAILDGEPANSEQNGSPGDPDPALAKVKTKRKMQTGRLGARFSLGSKSWDHPVVGCGGGI